MSFTRAYCAHQANHTSRILIPRHYSTPAPKASVKLIAEIRKQIEGTSLTKAREALQATNNDLKAALEWLERDLAVSGAAKAAKLQNRATGEGLVALALLARGGWDDRGRPQSVRAALVELNCETDFVARNDLFVELAQNVAYTAAFLTEPSTSSSPFVAVNPEALGDAPVMSAEQDGSTTSVSEAIRNGIAKLGEKISLRRVSTIVSDPIRDDTVGFALSSYVHGGATRTPSPSVTLQTGQKGSLVALGVKAQGLSPILRNVEAIKSFNTDFTTLGRSLAMQVTGLNAQSIRGSQSTDAGNPESTILYEQPFMMQLGAPTEESVEKVLRGWAEARKLRAAENEGVEVVDFRNWSVGEVVEDGTSS